MSVIDDLRKTGDVLCVDWYNDALDDVREALSNPTDEQVRTIADRVECSCESGYADTCPIHGASEWMVRAVLAATAGGDDGG